MAIEVAKMPRVFEFNGVILPDINPVMSIEQIRDSYVSAYPDLATATKEGPETTSDGKQKITFRRAVGSKG